MPQTTNAATPERIEGIGLDALEQRDNWRALWRLITHDWLLAILCVALFGTTLAYLFLPQSPPDGASDALGYSQWQSHARTLTNSAFNGLQDFGLFDLTHSGWARLLLAGMLIVLGLRLLDRASHLQRWRDPQHANILRDEARLRVTDHAPSLLTIAAKLRQRHYRVVLDPTNPTQPRWLSADRAPRAELVSMFMHAGLLIATLGMAANIGWGWDDQSIAIGSETRVILQNQRSLQLMSVNETPNTITVKLDEQAPQILSLAALSSPIWDTLRSFNIRVVEITPEFRVSATDVNAITLPLIVSSYADTQTEAVLTFRSGETDRSVAIGPEPAKLALLLSPAERSTTAAAGRIRAFALPAGRVITETNIIPNLVIEGVRINITPAFGAVLAARYQPGTVWILLGTVLALLGWLACLCYPMQRIVARLHAPDWTEFYASGRRVHPILREVIVDSEAVTGK